MHQVLVVDPSQRLAARVQISSLAQFNHVIDVFADGLGANERRLDAAVANHFRGQGPEQRLALIGGLGQFVESVAVTHHF